MNNSFFDLGSLDARTDYLLINKDLTKTLDSNSIQNKEQFSEKWKKLVDDKDASLAGKEPWMLFQLEWFLELYGFNDEDVLAKYLQSLADLPVFVDAGCGKGYKSAWLSFLCEKAEVVGIDFSDSVHEAANKYCGDAKKLYFVQSDIAAIPIKSNSVDLVLCDQVLHHTQNPKMTLKEFWRILKPGGKLFTYVYRKKPLPRELFDEYFRSAVHDLTNEEIWNIAEGMTALGKILTDNDVIVDLPSMPAIGIKGGRQSLQRYIYWNFFKCFWNPEMGYDASLSANFDWYAPSIAYRYTKYEFRDLVSSSGFIEEYFHEEASCLSARFVKA